MTKPEPTLLHRTIESRHERESPRAEVDAETLATLRPLVAEAVRSGEPVALTPTRWRLAATATPERLRARLWYGEPEGEPHVRMTVANGELVASMRGLARLALTDAATAAHEAGDLERCIAWAWLANREGEN